MKSSATRFLDKLEIPFAQKQKGYNNTFLVYNICIHIALHKIGVLNKRAVLER